MLDRDTRHQLAEFFAPLMEDERRRKALVTLALGSDAAVKFGIEWSGDPRTFTIELVNRLAQTTTGVMPDEPPLLALLEECRPYVGNDQWPRIDALCRMLRPQPSQPVWRGSPYPGLMAFTEPQAPIFFGRSRELRELLRKLALPEQHFVCVIGASGSGKSSLVAAGLIPALRRDAIAGNRDWLIIRCVPGKGNDPLLALAFELDRVLEGVGYRPEQVVIQLAEDPPPLDGIVQAALREQRSGTELLLFVDQLEELFTLVKEDAKVTAFIRLLGHAARHERIRLVATLRADFYAACLRHETLTELLRNGSFPLSPPGPAALYQMITQPAALAGLTLEEGLPERLLEETGADPGRLALLAFTLAELYKARQDKMLTLAAYQDLGGVHGAIGRQADKIFNGLGETARAALPVVFRELIEVNEAGVATRRRALLARVTTIPGAQELIDAFSSAQARLLVTDRDIADQPVVEVAHEALFSAWSPLAKWINERRDDLRLLHQVKTAADEWRRQGQDPTHLWLHERLAPVYEMLDRLDLKTDLEEPLKSFVRPEAERLLEEIERPIAITFPYIFRKMSYAVFFAHIEQVDHRYD
jgi:hypothetical protein